MLRLRITLQQHSGFLRFRIKLSPLMSRLLNNTQTFGSILAKHHPNIPSKRFSNDDNNKLDNMSKHDVIS